MAAVCVQNVMKLATVSQKLYREEGHTIQTLEERKLINATGLIAALKGLDILAVMITYSYQNMHIQQSNQTQIQLNFNSSQILVLAFPSQWL